MPSHYCCCPKRWTMTEAKFYCVQLLKFSHFEFFSLFLPALNIQIILLIFTSSKEQCGRNLVKSKSTSLCHKFDIYKQFPQQGLWESVSSTHTFLFFPQFFTQPLKFHKHKKGQKKCTSEIDEKVFFKPQQKRMGKEFFYFSHDQKLSSPSHDGIKKY